MGDLEDRLLNGVVDGPGDLMGIGECLNLLDELDARGVSADAANCIGELRRIFNRIILDESEDVGGDWGRIRVLMGTVCGGDSGDGKSEPAPPSSDMDWESIRNLMDQIADSPSVTEDAPAPAKAKADRPGEAVPASAPAKASASEPPRQSAAEDEAESMSIIQDPELLKDFIEEAREHLSSIELNMLALETNPDDNEAINTVFRPFHSIKGVAGFLNLKDIHNLSHEVENLLDAARSGKMVVTDSVIDIVLSAVDILKGLLSELEEVQGQENASVASSPIVRGFLGRIRNFSPDHPEDSFTPVRKIGEILVEKGVVDHHVIADVAEKTRASGKKLGEELINEGLASPRDVSAALREQRRTKESAASVRIDTFKLDNLVDMVGELVIAQSMVLQNPEVLRLKDQKLQKDSVQLSRITAELQRISMSMRMVPIKSTFQKMIRLVRDLCKKSGKEVNLVMKGEETEIDRNMVEEIYEPLVHMIRNAVDHGVETPDERVAVGKDPTGSVFISAEQKGGNIVIDLQDDGQGLDAVRIRSKAIERGIIAAEDHLDEKSIYELIMHPGFSTRDQVTEVSGRGVGMDVVKKSIERLRGKMEISSVRGRGTHFQLKLPLTMAIIDGMVIQIGPERYVVPTIAMKESLRPDQSAYLTVQGKGEMIKVRNSLMPLIRLHEVLQVEPRHRNPWEGLLLVVSEGKMSYCLLADEIIGRQEVVIKSLGGALRHLVGISGGAILGDGKVALIIDVKGMISLYEENQK